MKPMLKTDAIVSSAQSNVEARCNELVSHLPDSLKVSCFWQKMDMLEITKSATSRASEVDDLIKDAKWEATGGFDLWCQHEGKHLTRKDQNIEKDKRLERYVQLRIEKAKLEIV